MDVYAFLAALATGLLARIITRPAHCQLLIANSAGMKRDYPDRPFVGVGAVIVDHNRVLVVKRATEPLRGQWSIPGGAVELGETLREAVAREAHEETGLLIGAEEVIEVLDSIMRDAEGRPQYHYVLVDFLCRHIGGELCAASDVSDARWVTLEEIPSLQMTENAQRVIRKALGTFRISHPS